MSYDKEKVRRFKMYTIEDYKNSLDIGELAQVKKVKRTDGTFIQIGVRPLLEDNFLILPNFDPRLPGIGSEIAIGEIKFLIDELLNTNEIKREKLERDKIEDFPKYLDFNEAVIVISTKFYVDIFTRLMRRIDYQEGYPRLNWNYKIISIPEKIMGNKILIIDKRAILIEKQAFLDKDIGNEETIDININPVLPGKVEITIRSVNKIKYIETELIKIVEVNK